MNKISLIIKREYLSRVRKKSFIIMTVLGPLIMAAIFIVPVYIAKRSEKDKVIQVLDESGMFSNKFEDKDHLKFIYLAQDIETAKDQLVKSGDYALVHIPATELSIPQTVVIYSTKQPNVSVKSYIRNVMTKELENKKLTAEIKKLRLTSESKDINPLVNDNNLGQSILNNIKTTINLATVKLSKGGEEEESFTELSMGLGYIGGFMIYMFVFMFGAQVMRGVIEEKTNRIVEVIISSVKPFQLMMGKILGIALVGLTQFLLWVILTWGIVGVFYASYSEFMPKQTQEIQMTNPKLSPGEIAPQINQEEAGMTQIFEMIDSINFPVIIGSFLFFFLGGYLLYAALFASIGSAVDNETDTQQFMLPVTVPLILCLVMLPVVLENPDGPAAFWLSMIPFTSPVIMMVRIPFGVPWEQIALSMSLLVAGFIGTTWLAARIYRTGILMYGKKINYKEMWKWIRYQH